MKMQEEDMMSQGVRLDLIRDIGISVSNALMQKP
jgi:hypothetical protein